MGTASEAITAAKAARMVQLAEAYADEQARDAALRIDLIAIDFTPDGRMLSLRHYENAVTETEPPGATMGAGGFTLRWGS